MREKLQNFEEVLSYLDNEMRAKVAPQRYSWLQNWGRISEKPGYLYKPPKNSRGLQSRDQNYLSFEAKDPTVASKLKIYQNFEAKDQSKASKLDPYQKPRS